MKKILNYFQWFAYITTGVTIVCAMNFSLCNKENISRSTLWQILLSSFLTTIITVFFASQNADKKEWIILKVIFHYFCLCAIMIGCGVWFGWMNFDIVGVTMMMISVVGVYVIAFFLNYLMDKKQAEELNQVLNQKNM